MTIIGMLFLLVVGLVVGCLGRFFHRRFRAPGRRLIPIWLSIVVGVVAAFVGILVAIALGVPTGFELLLAVALAAIGVAVAATLYSRKAVSPATGRPVGEPSSATRRSPASSPAPTSWPTPPGKANDPRLEQTDPFHEPSGMPRSQQPVRHEFDAVLAGAPSGIFVSYRRADSRYAARGIADRLRNHFGRTEVFMDVDSLDAGVDFVEGVLRAIRASAVVVVLIGDQWLTAGDDRGRRRLDDPTDNVRMEIEHALTWKKPVLPVLLDGSDMPRPDELPHSLAPLLRLNAIPIDHLSWDTDIAALIRAVTRLRS